jgi:hypothetical protein
LSAERHALWRQHGIRERRARTTQTIAAPGEWIVQVPLEEATRELKLVTPDLYAEAEVFFG